VNRVDVVQVRCELAFSERATSASDVVAHCAVDPEQFGTVRCVTAREELLVRHSGSRSEACDPRGHSVDVALRELYGLLFGLGAASGHGHAAGSHLELDGKSANAEERRARLGAFGVEPVARRTVGGEQRLTVFDLRG
jgi:hypothetical protein